VRAFESRSIRLVACLAAGLGSLALPLIGRATSHGQGSAFVAASATEPIADGLRTATLDPGYGRKFAAENTRPRVTVSNPFMNLQRPLFADAPKLHCTADGGLVVAGRAGFDTDGRVLGAGFWKVASGGAVTPHITRTVGIYGAAAGTRCDAPFTESASPVGPFTVAADGRLLAAASASIVAVSAGGRVDRVAGSADDCRSDTASRAAGADDGPGPGARFSQPERPVEDSDGHLWVADQKGCALRRITPQGEVSTVLGPEVLCNDAVGREERPILDNLTWDAAHGELVTGGSRTVARPVHDLYTMVWRITPTGAYRRVLFGKKASRVSPAKQHLDGVSALAVDAQGRIFIISQLMLFERRGWDALQVLRIDEAGATVVEVTGARIPRGTNIDTYPLDGPVDRAVFNASHDMCFSPDGTLFVSDDILVRKVDTKGQVTTWLF